MTTEINPKRKRRRERRRQRQAPQALAIPPAVVVVAGIAWLLYHLFCYGRWHEQTNDAYVRAARSR